MYVCFSIFVLTAGYFALYLIVYYVFILGTASVIIIHFVDIYAVSFSVGALTAAFTMSAVVALAVYKCKTFPRKLADEVAPQVRGKLVRGFEEGDDGTFREQNKSILTAMVRDAFDKGCRNLVKKVIEDGVQGLAVVKDVEEAAKEWVEQKTEVYIETREVRDKDEW